MRIALATDHAGYPLKEMIVEELRSAGHDVFDLGTDGPGNPVDYPDVAEAACQTILEGSARCCFAEAVWGSLSWPTSSPEFGPDLATIRIRPARVWSMTT